MELAWRAGVITRDIFQLSMVIKLSFIVVLESFPNIIWIWDIHTLRLTTLLIQLAPVKSMAWSPRSEFLFFSTGNSRLLIWSP